MWLSLLMLLLTVLCSLIVTLLGTLCFWFAVAAAAAAAVAVGNRWCLEDFGLTLDEEQSQILFDKYDRDASGLVE